MSKLSIVMYHYVRDLKHCRYPSIKGLDIRLFEEQLLFLQKHYRFVTADEVTAALSGELTLPEKSVLLTFDDAYVDHFTNVYPLLDRLGIQGSFYIPVQAVSENRLLDVNKIHFVLAAEPDTAKTLRSLKELLVRYSKDFQLETFDSYYQRLAQANRFDPPEIIFIKRLLQHELPETLRGLISDELFQRSVGMDEGAFSRELYMSTEQVQMLHRNGMHVGCHGYKHYWWNKLTKSELVAELETSVSFLIDKIGIDPKKWTACYPYGSHNDQVEDQLAAMGCRYALTTEVDVATLHATNRFTLPRLDTNDLPKDRLAQTNDWYVRAE